jgi:hypothetical protein
MKMWCFNALLTKMHCAVFFNGDERIYSNRESSRGMHSTWRFVQQSFLKRAGNDVYYWTERLLNTEGALIEFSYATEAQTSSWRKRDKLYHSYVKRCRSGLSELLWTKQQTGICGILWSIFITTWRIVWCEDFEANVKEWSSHMSEFVVAAYTRGRMWDYSIHTCDCEATVSHTWANVRLHDTHVSECKAAA